jgi:hypothetical protein
VVASNIYTEGRNGEVAVAGEMDKSRGINLLHVLKSWQTIKQGSVTTFFICNHESLVAVGAALLQTLLHQCCQIKMIDKQTISG